MKRLEKALVDKLRAQTTLVSETGYSASCLAIAVVEPKQKILIPGVYVDADLSPMENADSSAIKQSEVTIYLVAKRRESLLNMAFAIESEFRDSNNREKKFDFTDANVYCISSRWVNMGAPRWSDAHDCYEMPVNLFVRWSLK